MTDITQHIGTLSITRSVDPIDASGTLSVSGEGIDEIGGLTGDLAIDSAVEVEVGYESGGDPLALHLTGQISSVSHGSSGANYDREVAISALSLFKNFSKTPVSTGWLENKTGEELLEMVVGEFMAWSKFDFSACAGTTFGRVKIDEMLIPEAIAKIAEACLCEVYFEGDGTIKAVPFPQVDAEPDFEYVYDDSADFNAGDQFDINMVNTLEIIGREIDPDEEDVPTTLVAERAYNWFHSDLLKFRVLVGSEFVTYAEINIPLNFSPILRPRLDIEEDMPGTATYTIIGYDDGIVTVRITRNPDDELEFPGIGFPDYNFTISVYGFLYQDSEYAKIRTTVVNPWLLDYYNNIRQEQTYENPFIQDVGALEQVGEFLLKKNYYSSFPLSFTLPHNSALEPNMTIEVQVIEEGAIVEYIGIVRSITTAWNASDYSLTDSVECWATHRLVLNVVDSSVQVQDAEVDVKASFP